MEILNATDAKREFGDVLLKAQKEPIAINKNGKTVAVVMSAVDYQTLTNQQESLLKIELQKGMDDLQAGRVADGNTVIERLKNRVSDAPL
jgi:prevent-host-death family protein